MNNCNPNYNNLQNEPSYCGAGENRDVTDLGFIGHYIAPEYKQMFSQQHITMMANKIHQLLLQQNLDIRPTDNVIKSLLESLYRNDRWAPEHITDYAIELIYNQILNENKIVKQNAKLSAWVQQYNGDNGIRQHPQIKLNQRRPTSTNFIPPRY